MKIYEKAPAKINLCLDVKGKRNDGYHEVEMIMTQIDLADWLTLSPLDRDAIVISSQASHIPLDENNLAYQAARLIKSRFQIKKGVYIHLDKRIPVSAGLAGGSSDAAAVLRGLNRMWDLRLTEAELRKLAGELGSDVPFCVTGGTMLARGRGERLAPLPSPPHCWVVLAKPAISVSTREIYGNLVLEDITHRPSAEAMVSALQAGDFKEMCRRLGNVLEALTMQKYPEVARIKELMRRLGAEGALMSGSGPTVFGLVSRQSQTVRIYNGLRGFCKDVFVARMLA